ncbi:hypothetical protein N7454_009786 [Penicillium verhagenii]|nr:hypothetical protein N7454_009786 [Penicillium verhagenii]
MDRNRPLPLADEWQDPDSYIEALLFFANSNELFINLCGGVHILDFLTREPDLYTTLLPEDWIAFFHQHDTQDIIRLLLREDIGPLREPDYIYNVRRLSLRREFTSPDLGKKTKLNKHVAMGMKKKKLHEVQHFSRYVAGLSETVEQRRGEPVSHIVDFGSGQNYLGRTLASSPYHKHIIAIERKHQYISGAKDMDVNAKLAEKEKKDHTYVINNKKNKACNECDESSGVADSEPTDPFQAENLNSKFEDVPAREVEENIEDVTIFKMLGEITLEPDELLGTTTPNVRRQKAEEEFPQARGTLSYIEHEIEDGYLEPIIDHVTNPPPAEQNDGKNSEEPSIPEQPSKETRPDPRVMVVSLHSCGNLVHHGVRSLILNPSVVASVSGPQHTNSPSSDQFTHASTKPEPPTTRTASPCPNSTRTTKNAGTDGMKLNITARSMAVQAPYNWGHADSEDFFTRNYYRALLQRILVDRGVVPKPGAVKDLYEESNGTAAVIIGSLGKTAFKSFTAYMRAAIVKLTRDPNHGAKVSENVGTMSDEDFQRYDTEYRQARKNLSVVWSLMAFSAQVVETVIVVDRWQYLREHDSVKECWIEPVFDYSESPRNLAVIGLKK